MGKLLTRTQQQNPCCPKVALYMFFLKGTKNSVKCVL